MTWDFLFLQRYREIPAGFWRVMMIKHTRFLFYEKLNEGKERFQSNFHFKELHIIRRLHGDDLVLKVAKGGTIVSMCLCMWIRCE